MQKQTLQRILSDPDFDPSTIFESALIGFIEDNPSKVAQDKVCLRHLVKDREIVGSIVGVVDMNDTQLIADFLNSIHRSDSWDANKTLKKLLKRLKEVETANVAAIFETIKEHAPASRLTKMHLEFVDKLDQGQIDEFVQAAVKVDGIESWNTEDWQIAFRSTEGTHAFLDALVKGKLSYKRGLEGVFPLISTCATTIQNDTKAKNILVDYLDDTFKGYVCFRCGRGSGRDYNGDPAENNTIKSNSGYTLHRKSCDEDGEFLSPHEIFTGEPKKLVFRCRYCSETFTTRSGCTLHEKSCEC